LICIFIGFFFFDVCSIFNLHSVNKMDAEMRAKEEHDDGGIGDEKGDDGDDNKQENQAEGEGSEGDDEEGSANDSDAEDAKGQAGIAEPLQVSTNTIDYDAVKRIFELSELTEFVGGGCRGFGTTGRLEIRRGRRRWC
jgi:hypothetical protein